MKPKPKKTQAEEAYDLLNEFCDENKISSKIMSPEEEIARRLAKLKGETFVSEASSSTVNDIDYDQDVNTYLKAYEQQKAGKESESSSEMYSNLLDESKRLEIHTIDQEIRNLMKKRGKKSIKVENLALSNRETESGESDDESELEQVIEQALMTKDDEDELEDDTKYRFDAINRNQMR
uniref:Uncharacterized protein n=1 Tax=Romanomermis culicivorax TaxID=13658 RepID=A0A915JGC4_ROMCU